MLISNPATPGTPSSRPASSRYSATDSPLMLTNTGKSPPPRRGGCAGGRGGPRGQGGLIAPPGEGTPPPRAPAWAAAHVCPTRHERLGPPTRDSGQHPVGPARQNQVRVGSRGDCSSGESFRAVVRRPDHVVSVGFRAQLVACPGAMNPCHPHAEGFRLPGGERHRRYTQAPADQHDTSKAGHQVKSMSEWAHAAETVADTHGEKLCCSIPDRFEHNFDPAVVDAIYGERTPQQWARRPAKVDELPGPNRGRDLRRIHRDDEHVARHLALGG